MGKTKPIIVCQGGQYGSEAKGLITAKLTKDRRVDIAIRTGTVNAGHTVYYGGRPYAMQQLPVAWVRPECKLVIGPGAYINPEILQREIGWINEAMPGSDVRDRIFIDHRCGIHLDIHTERSTKSGRHHAMGATGKGSSEAVIDKIKGRGGNDMDFYPLFSSYMGEWRSKGANQPLESLRYCDTVRMVNNAYDSGQQILIEGTQGTLLDLHLGPYPYTTHKQTQAANWMAEAGLSCTLPIELVSVMRTYPIRVAGNSGPLPQELSWTQLAGHINQRLRSRGKDQFISSTSIRVWEEAVRERAGAKGDPAHWDDIAKAKYPSEASEIHRDAWDSIAEAHQMELRRLFEMTTVTKKLRRIAEWNPEMARESIMLNRPTSVALTFLNYLFPEAWGVTRATFGKLPIETRARIYSYVGIKQDELGVPITYVGFGPDEESTFLLYADEISGKVAGR